MEPGAHHLGDGRRGLVGTHVDDGHAIAVPVDDPRGPHHIDGGKQRRRGAAAVDGRRILPQAVVTSSRVHKTGVGRQRVVLAIDRRLSVPVEDEVVLERRRVHIGGTLAIHHGGARRAGDHVALERATRDDARGLGRHVPGDRVEEQGRLAGGHAAHSVTRHRVVHDDVLGEEHAGAPVEQHAAGQRLSGVPADDVLGDGHGRVAHRRQAAADPAGVVLDQVPSDLRPGTGVDGDAPAAGVGVEVTDAVVVPDLVPHDGGTAALHRDARGHRRGSGSP